MPVSTETVAPSVADNAPARRGVSDSVPAEGCFNPYYPLRSGSSITYRMKTGATEVPVTTRVLERTPNTAKLEYSFAIRDRVATMTNELVCEDGSMKGKGYFDFAQAFSGLDVTYDTISMDGDILPNDLDVGREWTLSTEVEMHTTNTQMKAILDGRRQKTTVKSRVLKEEDVTVPAGTFHALAIEQKMTLEGMMNGTPIETTSYVWFAKDIGLIKSEHHAGKTTSTLEAIQIDGVR